MKTVRIAELKAHLSAYLQIVRRGIAVRVMDRDTPIADIVPLPQAPLPPLPSRPAKGSLADFVWPPPPKMDPTFDSLADLLEDRKDRF